MFVCPALSPCLVSPIPCPVWLHLAESRWDLAPAALCGALEDYACLTRHLSPCEQAPDTFLRSHVTQPAYTNLPPLNVDELFDELTSNPGQQSVVGVAVVRAPARAHNVMQLLRLATLPIAAPFFPPELSDLWFSRYLLHTVVFSEDVLSGARTRTRTAAASYRDVCVGLRTVSPSAPPCNCGCVSCCRC